MSAAYTTVAFSRDVGWQLLGVVLSAVQGGLGEASCLAMCTFFDSRAAITLWSSGTGFAGEGMMSRPVTRGSERYDPTFLVVHLTPAARISQ